MKLTERALKGNTSLYRQIPRQMSVVLPAAAYKSLTLTRPLHLYYESKYDLVTRRQLASKTLGT